MFTFTNCAPGTTLNSSFPTRALAGLATSSFRLTQDEQMVKGHKYTGCKWTQGTRYMTRGWRVGYDTWHTTYAWRALRFCTSNVCPVSALDSSDLMRWFLQCSLGRLRSCTYSSILAVGFDCSISPVGVRQLRHDNYRPVTKENGCVSWSCTFTWFTCA